METILTKPNYKRFIIESDKPFFAAYLNTAKANLFIILRDISESSGIKFDLSNDDNMLNADLWKYLKTNNEPEITQRVIEKLEFQFPFANYLAKNYAFYRNKERVAEPNDYYKVFEFLIKQLYEYRNYYSHAVHEKVYMSKEILKGLKILYDASWRQVKKRFSLKTTDVNHLVRLGKGGKEINNFYYGFSNENETETEKGFAFFVCLWLQRKDAQMFLKKTEGFKKSESPSQKATLETFTNFSARIPQPKLTSDNSTEGLLLDMVNELKSCPKELYPLLSDTDREKFKPVDEDKEKVADDEYEAMPVLKRSNNRFFYFATRYLDNAFQNIKFHIDLGNYCFNVYDQEIEGTTRKRRWIKRMTAFGNLNDFADENRPTEWKEKIQKLEDREIENPDIYVTETTPHYHINGQNIGIKFINNYEGLKKEKKIWPALPVFDSNNTLKPNPTIPRNEAPDCWLSLYELPAIVFYHLLQIQTPGIDSVKTIIDNHRKQMKAFFNEIENNKIKPGFTKGSLQKELEKWNIDISNVPKAICRYLTNKQVTEFGEKAAKRLNGLLSETNEMLSKIQRQEKHFNNKPGSKDYVEMKSGHMADFLARDMIILQKPLDEMDGKPNSTEFQVLQAKLAYFGKNKDTLHQTFKLCNLTGSKNPHPFLHKINISQCAGILDFYKEYLELRIKYLELCTKEKNYHGYHFLKLGEKTKEAGQPYITKLANKLQKEAVMNLPRGLFLRPIKHALKTNDNTKILAGELENKRVNVAYIIGEYFNKIRNDQPQEFYNAKKSYELLNKLYDKRAGKEKRDTLEKKYYNTDELSQKTAIANKGTKDNELTGLLTKKIEAHCIKEKIVKPEDKERARKKFFSMYNDFTENEKQIRLAKTTDMVLFLIADDIFRKNFIVDKGIMKDKKADIQAPVEIGEGYKLAEIRPDSDKGFLSLQTSVKLEIPYTYETNLNKVLKVKDARPVPSPLDKKVIEKETIKIKNYGDFRGFLKDRRINSLLPYLKDNKIQFEALEQEFEFYSEARAAVFERIFRFEKAVTGAVTISKNNGYIKHTEILKQKIGKNDERFSKILQLRNAFSHSNYPDYILFKDDIDGSGFNELKNYTSGNKNIQDKSIAIQFKNLTLKYYDELDKP